ncbi:hypothetical protein DES42_1171, partial [Zavarzinia compransoris]
MMWRRLLQGLALLGLSAWPAAAAEWVDEWQALAARTGFEGHRKFADLLADPAAVAL